MEANTTVRRADGRPRDWKDFAAPAPDTMFETHLPPRDTAEGAAAGSSNVALTRARSVDMDGVAVDRPPTSR